MCENTELEDTQTHLKKNGGVVVKEKRLRQEMLDLSHELFRQ